MRHHPLSHVLLVDPERVATRLEELRAARVEPVPNVWQVTLGVLRMWHRVVFRSETIGTCRDFRPRATWRARLLAFRPLRFPFLLAERAVHPLDFSGLRSDEDRVVAHLLGAHHDGVQFLYDLELLRDRPGALERVRAEARRVVERDDARSRWLRDLVVFERYHENLLAAVEAFLDGTFAATEAQLRDPDIALAGYLAWCTRQPETPEATWQALRGGQYTVADGLVPPTSELETAPPAATTSELGMLPRPAPTPAAPALRQVAR